jgi:DNA-directed RNA polymerase sigma subunit (sigma70/sigma32)
MAQSLEDVLSALTPERRARVEARVQELMEEELTLRDLRRAQHLTQERMAKLLGVDAQFIAVCRRSK